MLPKTLLYGVVFACGLLALAGLHHPGNRCPATRILALACASAAADDENGHKNKPALSGVWLQDGEEMQIEFAGKDMVKLLPHGGNDCIIVCQYTVEKKGLIKAKITELEGNAKKELEKILPVGLEFSFRWTVKDDTATLEEVKGEIEKSHLEGKYRKGDKRALSGVWVQNGEEMQIEFAGKDMVKFLPHGGNDCTIVCRYTVEKKGLVKAKITELEGNAKKELEKILPVGLEFSFKWTVKDDTATLEEVKGEIEKSHLEGKYRQKK